MRPVSRLLFTSDELRKLVAHVSDSIFELLDVPPEVIVPIMSGACMFGVDLFRELESRGPSPEFVPVMVKRDGQAVPHLHDEKKVVRYLERYSNILLVDTINDTGSTIATVATVLRSHHQPTINVACLFSRLNAPDLVGSTSIYGYVLPTKEYLYGYGLDCNQQFRGLPDVWAIPPSPAVPESLFIQKGKV